MLHGIPCMSLHTYIQLDFEIQITSYLVLITVTGNSVVPAKDRASTPKQKDSTEEGFDDLK